MSEKKLPRQKSLIVPDVQNPFVHQLHLSTLEKIQIALMTVTVFPVRLLLVSLCLCVTWFFARLALIGKKDDDLKQPLTGWRRFCGPLCVIFARLVFFVGGFHWISVRGERVSSEEVEILATAPHSTFFDALAIVGLGMTSVVAKSEAEQVPLFGTLIRFTQPVFVSREDPNSRQNTIKEIKKRAQSSGEWPQFVIFPEGTCTNRSCLITFKPGAFYPGVAVQPVCLKYNNSLDTVTWTWDGPGAWKVLWLTLCQFHNKFEIEFLPVYKPTEEEINNPRMFAENVRAVMARALGVPTTDHTFEDCRLMMYASKLNFPAAAGLVEFHKIQKKLGMNYDNLKELLSKFCSIAQKNKGQLTLDEFAQCLEMPVSDPLKEIFELYDRDGSGTIDFREYVIGLHLVAQPANTEETIHLAFQLFDSGGKGYLTEPELIEIMDNAFGMEERDIRKLFQQVDADQDGRITYGEFKTYSVTHPEYAKLFTTYRELKERKQLQSNGNMGSKVKAD